MNNSRSFLVASSMVLGLIVACGGGDATGGFGGDAGGGPTPDTGGHVIPGTDTGTTGSQDVGVGSNDTGVVSTGDTGTGTGAGDAPSGTCAPNCSSDSDCQSTCPAVSGALNCCDPGSGVCFTSSESVCPDQVPEGGTSGTGSGGGY
jgi:hypothetical protein